MNIRKNENKQRKVVEGESKRRDIEWTYSPSTAASRRQLPAHSPGARAHRDRYGCGLSIKSVECVCC